MTNSGHDSRASDSAKPVAHLRLTPESILTGWIAGYYTPAGYLYHLLLSLRKEGWWYRIDNVTQFCRQWQINRRTFYRAKAELVSQGTLEESIIGAIDLRVRIVSQIDSPVANLAQPVTDLTQLPPETVAQQASCDPSDLLQISYRSLSDPESAILNERERQKNWASDPKFRQWLKDRAKSLPEPPQFLEVWIEAQVRKESFQREYRASQRISEQTDLPPPAPDRFQIESACLAASERGDRDYLLMRLRGLWDEGWTELVEELALGYPGWSVVVTCSGVEELANG